ncbi:iron-sulfur cluster scaffold-like protein [Ktedonobacter robiniae]|uniref:Iron-sulfur cluster scaffold-like protein n=2 Tax=Ktedonobacter robiniae TaxID=2778365 RepID=A0ABQ3V4B2_9CHLR|nr:iron-sulfur cluster scaffold-like protein [Ktedonobacter robiniae]
MTMSLDYDREFILDHYRNPRNYEVLEQPDGHSEGVNPVCGDRVALDIRVENGRITRIGFQGRGCTISQASASILTEVVENQTVEEVAMLTQEAFLDTLGIPISPARSNCAFLALNVLHACLKTIAQDPSPKTAKEAN